LRDTFIKTLEELAAADERIMLLTGDLGFGVLDRFVKRLPKQFLNVGVAEQNLAGIATGLALEGRIVFTYSIANFPTLRCLEQLRNDAAYHDANVKVVAIGGGFSYGALGMSHHATEDLAVLRAMPSVTVVAPADLHETAAATRAIVERSGVCYLRLDKSVASATDGAPPFVLGRARRLREGDGLTIVSCGGVVGEVLTASEQLASEGFRVRVLSLHTVKPIDVDALRAAASETGGILTVEEHVAEGGLGSAVAETCMDGGFAPRRFHRLAIRGGFVSHVGSQDYLRRAAGLDAAAIAKTARTMLAARAST
jgi:transketolase